VDRGANSDGGDRPGSKSLAVSPGGRLVAIAASNGTIRLRETATGKLVRALVAPDPSGEPSTIPE
jgi:hypothetical protein